jgi:serine protease Do
MKTTIEKYWKQIKTRAAVPVLVLALLVSLGSYAILKPAGASAATTAPAAVPLDTDSVSAILALDRATETLAAQVTPAVVNVTVTARVKAAAAAEVPDELQRFFGPSSPFGRQMRPQPQVEHGLGSGFVISPNGYIVTNNHVIENATDIHVTFSDRRVLRAKLVGADPLTDLAVIKVEGSNMPTLPWGDSNQLHPGQTVLAFGNPFTFQFTVTRGIVSGLHRANPFSDNARKPGQFIQTDAAINQGNSGGPLVDARGEVVGINTFLISPSGAFSGMGFAIPAQIAQPTVATLIKDGKVNHAYIGVGISDVTPENAKFFKMSETAGAVVTQVEPDAPGAKAGLKVGDVITAVNNQKVGDAGELQATISEKRPGTRVTLEVMRDGSHLSLPVTLQEFAGNKERAEAGTSGQQGKARWGLGLMDITPELRDQLQAPADVHGAVVSNVQPGSSADNAGISQGDVILEVNRHAVQNTADVRRALESVPAGQDAMLLIWSKGGSTFRVLHATGEGL